ADLPEVSADNKKRIASATYGRLTGEVKIRLDGNHVSFDLRRICRLRNPHARALLTQYTAHVARDAYDRPMV
ncbi:MAG TPA: hypothetical protein VFE45_00475, partial [Coriobacteriia bacterium]|nr:hypothetical protein [Coriobacteriia bacterium]